MNGEQITAFLQEHWNWVTLIIGAVLLIGAIMNWNWRGLRTLGKRIRKRERLNEIS